MFRGKNYKLSKVIYVTTFCGGSYEYNFKQIIVIPSATTELKSKEPEEADWENDKEQ